MTPEWKARRMITALDPARPLAAAALAAALGVFAHQASAQTAAPSTGQTSPTFGQTGQASGQTGTNQGMSGYTGGQTAASQGMTGYPSSATNGAPVQGSATNQAGQTEPAPDQGMGLSNPQWSSLSKGVDSPNTLASQSLTQEDVELNAGRSAFARDRNISVAQRPHPEYQPYFIYMGSFILKPQFDTALGYNDNIYASQANRVSDEDLNLKPALAVQSNWLRDSLSGFINTSYDWYFSHSTESQAQADLGATYQKDFLTNSYLQIAGEYASRVEPRSDTTGYFDAKEPLRYDYGYSDLTGVLEENRYRFTADLAAADYSFHDQDGANGIPLDLQSNNHLDTTASLKAEYAYVPAVSFYVTGIVNNHDYPNTFAGSKSRDSNGYIVALGSNFDLTHLMRGDISVGYLDQTYRAAGISPTSGLSLNGKLEYFPTQLTTVTFTATRAIEDTTYPEAPAYVTVGGSAKIDHELFRDIILTAYADYFSDNYQGVTRTDTRWAASAQATYLMNRRMVWTLAYRLNDLSSSGVDKVPGFQENEVILTLSLRY